LLSSPKDKDYEIIGEEKRIRKDTYLIFRIKSVSKGKAELKGTIQFSKMIPVPNRELIEYDVCAETDINYKNLVLEEIQYIRKNSEKIVKYVQTFYAVRFTEKHSESGGVFLLAGIACVCYHTHIRIPTGILTSNMISKSA